jgi:hypothetical protein
LHSASAPVAPCSPLLTPSAHQAGRHTSTQAHAGGTQRQHGRLPLLLLLGLLLILRLVQQVLLLLLLAYVMCV